MTYQELQKKAKELGLKYVGVAKDELEKAIEAAEGNNANAQNSAIRPETADIPEAQMEKESTNYNAAYVIGDNKKARKYTKEIHGENFVELAYQYATKNKLRVELKNDAKVIVCPNCGEKITR